MNRMFLQLALTKGIGDVAIKKVMGYLEQNNYSWDDLQSSTTQILLESGLKNDVIHGVEEAKPKADKLSEELVDQGIDLLIENDIRYPQYLKKMLGDNCPPFLFIKGNRELLNRHSVGFCGSRKASSKGLCIASDCAKQLAEKSITVVSGYASGADLAAHRAALLCGGSTIFVLAEGILRTTMKGEIRELLNAENHIFISQFMPKITWNAGNAMRRNKVIIGISRAMILVESGNTGGTFAAGKESLKVGCPLFVIDFAQPEVSAEANPHFISAGGKPIRRKNGSPNVSKVLDVVNQDIRSKISNSFYHDSVESQIRFHF